MTELYQVAQAIEHLADAYRRNAVANERIAKQWERQVDLHERSVALQAAAAERDTVSQEDRNAMIGMMTDMLGQLGEVRALIATGKLEP